LDRAEDEASDQVLTRLIAGEFVVRGRRRSEAAVNLRHVPSSRTAGSSRISPPPPAAGV
jgi:hypothetical protein